MSERISNTVMLTREEYGELCKWRLRHAKLEHEYKALEDRLKAPTDTDVEQSNTLCERFNNGDIDMLGLVCKLWNDALAARIDELLEQQIEACISAYITQIKQCTGFDLKPDNVVIEAMRNARIDE